MISSCTRATSYNTRSMPHWLPSQAAMDRDSNLCGRRSRWFGVGLPSRRRAQCHCALWQVSDSASPLLMDQLYSELQAGKSPDEALRAAKLTLIHTSPHLPQAPVLGRISALRGCLKNVRAASGATQGNIVVILRLA